MISGMSSVASSYLRLASTFGSNSTLAPADAQPDSSTTTDGGTSGPGSTSRNSSRCKGPSQYRRRMIPSCTT